MRARGRVSRRSFLLGAGLGGASGYGLNAAVGNADPPARDRGSLDVRDFGADGSGQSDDVRAIQEALDVAGESGQEVRLPPGAYGVSAPLEVPAGVTVRGAGKDATLIEAGNDDLPTLLTHRKEAGANPPAKDVLIEDLALRGGRRTLRCLLIEGLSRSDFVRLRLSNLSHPESVGLLVTSWDDDGTFRTAADNNFYSLEIADCTTGARLTKAARDPATFGPGFHNFYGLRIFRYTRRGFDMDAGEGTTAVALRCTANTDGVTHIRLNDDVPTLLAPGTDCTDAKNQTGLEITENCTSALVLNPLGDLGREPSNTRIADRGRGTIVLREGLSR